MYKIDKFKKFVPYQKIEENSEEITSDNTDDNETVIIPADSTNPAFQNAVTDVTNSGTYNDDQNCINNVSTLNDTVLTFAQFVQQELDGAGDYEAEITITQENPVDCDALAVTGADTTQLPIDTQDVLEEGEDATDVRQTISELEDETYDGDDESNLSTEYEDELKTTSDDVKRSGQDEFNEPFQGDEYEEYIENEFEEDESDDEKDGVFTFSDWQKRKRTNESRFQKVEDFIQYYEKKYSVKKK